MRNVQYLLLDSYQEHLLDSYQDHLLDSYRALIIASLRAQRRDDVAEEDRIIDALDLLWSRMTQEQRSRTEEINRSMAAWFASQQVASTMWSKPGRFQVSTSGAVLENLFQLQSEVPGILSQEAIWDPKVEWRSDAAPRIDLSSCSHRLQSVAN